MGLFDAAIRKLGEALFGRRDAEVTITDIVNTETDPAKSMVRFLKQLPAEDKAKKRELANFFKTVEGEQYSKQERKRAYDELLGPSRNRDFIG